MTYIIADIHGCYDEYKDLIEKLSITNKDSVYILGDAIDRGENPIRVLKDIMNRSNFTYILGNHDLMMIHVLRSLMQEITPSSIAQLESNDALYFSFEDWMKNGGGVTFRQFLGLERWEREDILCFLEECSFLEALEHNQKLYILVHAGLSNFSSQKELDEYSIGECVWEKTDYQRQYFNSERIFLVTGHTPVQTIRPDKLPIVYTENQHIALDCGCVFGGRLAAYCIETGETTYVERFSQ